jgi:hypothetical protein
MLLWLCLSGALCISAAAATDLVFSNALKAVWSNAAKIDPVNALDLVSEVVNSHIRCINAEKDGKIVGLTGTIAGLSMQVEALECEKKSLNDMLGRANVDFLRASRSLSIRGVLSLFEARYTTMRVENCVSRASVWEDIFRRFPFCLRSIVAYDPTMTSNRAAQLIAGIFQNANIAIHSFGLNAIPLGKGTFTPDILAVLKGIMDNLPISYTEVDDPNIGPLAN